MNLKSSLLLSLIFLCIAGCGINDFVAPTYNVNAHLPFVDRTYTVADMIKNNQNLSVDSVTRNILLHANSNSRGDFINNIKYNGVSENNILIGLNRDTVLHLKFDDSSEVRKASFISGSLNLLFRNPNSQPYNYNVKVRNLLKNSTSQPLIISGTVSGSGFENYSFPLDQYFIDNGNLLLNNFDFEVTTSSSLPGGIATFDYGVTPTVLSAISGRIKPAETFGILDTVASPFGTNAPTQTITLTTIKKSEIIIKNFAYTTILFQKAFFSGFNRNTGIEKRLYYDYDNNGTKDSLYTITLPKRNSGEPYSELHLDLNTTNSNILEFLGNVPTKIKYLRNERINPVNDDISISDKDSILTNFYADIPLKFSTGEYNSYKDTTFSHFTSQQLSDISKINSANVMTKFTNGLGLALKVKILIEDDAGDVLLDLSTKVPGGSSDSTFSVNAADVDGNGTVLPGGERIVNYNLVLDKNDINTITLYRKVFVELKYITNPSAPVIRLTADDITKVLSIGEIEYRINP